MFNTIQLAELLYISKSLLGLSTMSFILAFVYGRSVWISTFQPIYLHLNGNGWCKPLNTFRCINEVDSRRQCCLLCCWCMEQHLVCYYVFLACHILSFKLLLAWSGGGDICCESNELRRLFDNKIIWERLENLSSNHALLDGHTHNGTSPFTVQSMFTKISLGPRYLQADPKPVWIQPGRWWAMGATQDAQRAVMRLGLLGTYVTCMWQVDWPGPCSSWWFLPRATPRGRWSPPAAPQTPARNLWLRLPTTKQTRPGWITTSWVGLANRKYQCVRARRLSGSSGAVPSKSETARFRCKTNNKTYRLDSLCGPAFKYFSLVCGFHWRAHLYKSCHGFN